MRPKLTCVALAAGLLFAEPVSADSHDEGLPGAGLEDSTEWGTLSGEGFGNLVKVAWDCGNLSSHYEAFGFESLARDNIEPVLRGAELFGAGKSQLLILENVFDLGRATAATELEAEEWSAHTDSEEYNQMMRELAKGQLKYVKICIMYYHPE